MEVGCWGSRQTRRAWRIEGRRPGSQAHAEVWSHQVENEKLRKKLAKYEAVCTVCKHESPSRSQITEGMVQTLKSIETDSFLRRQPPACAAAASFRCSRVWAVWALLPQEPKSKAKPKKKEAEVEEG